MKTQIFETKTEAIIKATSLSKIGGNDFLACIVWMANTSTYYVIAGTNPKIENGEKIIGYYNHGKYVS